MSRMDQLRKQLVAARIEARGVRDALVLAAMRTVPREKFVPKKYQDESYSDIPLPIGSGQTISQPYIVAFMIEALGLSGGEKVLEIGAGSGYAAAILSKIAGDVFTIERIGQLAEMAARNLADAGCKNVHVRHADGTQGWAEEAPFDAILVSAGGPNVPKSLQRQLAIGGRMVIPIGQDPRAQELVRVLRVSEDEFEQEDIADVRFVPLIGEEGWDGTEEEAQIHPPRVVRARPAVSITIPDLITKHAEPFSSIENADLKPLLDRISDARVVLIGEASHGTSEFYRMRALITRRLIAERGFNIVAAEADWPDANKIDQYVRHRFASPAEWAAFARFPTWMWRNEETRDFVDWLHTYNLKLDYPDRAGFYGLDLYSLYLSVNAVLKYLDSVDPALAAIARERYGCLSPWEADPAAYGHAAITGQYRKCEQDVAHILVELLQKHTAYAASDGERFFDAAQNARLVANAEHYYRTMFYGSRASWNLRDTHMFETLTQILDYRGSNSKAVVWAHNSHVGNAAATEMGRRGEHNIGQLCHQHFGDKTYHIGFGTNAGTVAAASSWDGELEIKEVAPAHPQSYERLFHMSKHKRLMLPLNKNGNRELIEKLMGPRLQRAIGVIYRPETELTSHYFEAILPQQFDEYIWFDATKAVRPLVVSELEGLPETYPFGL